MSIYCTLSNFKSCSEQVMTTPHMLRPDEFIVNIRMLLMSKTNGQLTYCLKLLIYRRLISSFPDLSDFDRASQTDFDFDILKLKCSSIDAL